MPTSERVAEPITPVDDVPPTESRGTELAEEFADLELILARSRLRSESRRAQAADDRRHRVRRTAIVVASMFAALTIAGAIVLLTGAVDAGDGTTRVDRGAGATSVADASGRVDDGRGRPDSPSAEAPPAIPLAERMERAERYADSRGGAVSFALVDGEGGRVRGRDERRLYPSASVVKAMLLAAELQRLDVEGLPLDSATRSLLTSMITVSDNDAATAIYGRVGDSGLEAIAQRVGMRDFDVALSWGYAQITAGDMARLFSQLDRAMPDRFSEFGKGILGSVTPDQAWGVPTIARDWSVRFKGGWRPTDTGQLVSQAAEMRKAGRLLSIAILTDGQPSMEYGIETVEGVASRLLGERR